MRLGLEETVDALEPLGPKDMRKAFPSLKGSTDNALLRLHKELFSAEKGARGRDNIFRTGMMTALSKKSQELLVKVMEQDVKPRIAGEVDEPVTTDVKRLIRLPGSLHGKSGLMVVPLSYSQLQGFDALRDAVPDTHGDDDVNVEMRFDAEVELKGETFRLSGEETVPSYLAVYLLGRRMADLAPP